MPPVPPYGAIAERRLIERLLKADAIGAGSAHSLENLRALEARRLRRLIARGVVREAAVGQYYIYPPALGEWMANLRARRLVAMLVLVTCAAATAAFAAFIAAR